MDKTHPLTSPMIVRSFDVKKDHLCPPKEGGEFLRPEVSYLSTFGILIYLANYIRSDIAF